MFEELPSRDLDIKYQQILKVCMLNFNEQLNNRMNSFAFLRNNRGYSDVLTVYNLFYWLQFNHRGQLSKSFPGVSCFRVKQITAMNY